MSKHRKQKQNKLYRLQINEENKPQKGRRNEKKDKTEKNEEEKNCLIIVRVLLLPHFMDKITAYLNMYIILIVSSYAYFNLCISYQLYHPMRILICIQY